MPAQAWVTLIVGVALTVRKRTIADKRAQAWQRITLCLERTTSDKDIEVELGWDIYATVTDSALITRTEQDVPVAVSDRAAARRALADQGQNEDTDTENDQQGDQR